METSENPANQPKRTLLTGFSSFDSVAQNYTPKYLDADAYLYCRKNLGKNKLPRCPLLEQIYNYGRISISFDGIYYPPNFPKPTQSNSHSEYKLATIGQLINVLNWWVIEKVEPEHLVFWFYAYSSGSCKLRANIVGAFGIDNLITEFNYSHPAIAAELKDLWNNLIKKAFERDEQQAHFVLRSQCWIDVTPRNTVYNTFYIVNPFEVKKAAAALLYKLQLIGSIVREEQKLNGGDNTKNPDGCVAKRDYKWQAVQKKVIAHWKELQTKGVKDFPSLRSIAKELKENAGTVRTAIGYDLNLSKAYSKNKPYSKKIAYKAPETLDYTGPKAGKRGGKPDPAYEIEKERLICEIKKQAGKFKKDFSPDVKALGDIVFKNLRFICNKLENPGLQQLLDSLKEKKANLKNQLELFLRRIVYDRINSMHNKKTSVR